MEFLKEQLEYEYERFKREMICTSRLNIYAKSKEITQKKELSRELMKRIEEEDITSGQEVQLRVMEHMLETLYLFTMDRKENTAHEVVEKWLDLLEEPQGGLGF